jgi:hypothetical protein
MATGTDEFLYHYKTKINSVYDGDGVYEADVSLGLNKMLEVISYSLKMNDFLLQMEFHGYHSLKAIKKNINDPFVAMAIIVAYSAGECVYAFILFGSL